MRGNATRGNAMSEGEHWRCPNCFTDLNGGSIWQTFYDQAITGTHYTCEGRCASAKEAEQLADKSAALYGATRTKGRWGRAIGIYDVGKDRTTRWQCPDCKHEWPKI